jgi:hypothetical protein
MHRGITIIPPNTRQSLDNIGFGPRCRFILDLELVIQISTGYLLLDIQPDDPVQANHRQGGSDHVARVSH